MANTAKDINWMPEHIKDGRFGKWLEGARDWAISRNRYWGAPMPIWVNEQDENDYIVVESVEQLRSLAGNDAKLDDLHRPFIDNVTFVKDGKTYRRIEEVLDCWFESGSMPVAQQHYPLRTKTSLTPHSQPITSAKALIRLDFGFMFSMLFLRLFSTSQPTKMF